MKQTPVKTVVSGIGKTLSSIMPLKAKGSGVTLKTVQIFTL
jgi:hypothetical protein